MLVRLQREVIEDTALLSAFAAGRRDLGAVASFSGRVRDDGGVSALELESYPGFSESLIEAEASQATAACGLIDLMVVHRIGRVLVGETVVLVAAAAVHRRQAFQAVDRMMDFLKTGAPLWKREHGAQGPRWIEPRPEDHADAARWSRS